MKLQSIHSATTQKEARDETTESTSQSPSGARKRTELQRYIQPGATCIISPKTCLKGPKKRSDLVFSRCGPRRASARFLPHASRVPPPPAKRQKQNQKGSKQAEMHACVEDRRGGDAETTARRTHRIKEHTHSRTRSRLIKEHPMTHTVKAYQGTLTGTHGQDFRLKIASVRRNFLGACGNPDACHVTPCHETQALTAVESISRPHYHKQNQANSRLFQHVPG